MKKAASEAFQQRFIHDCEVLALKHPVVHFELPMSVVITMIAQMQLAMRHQGNPTESKKVARKLCEELIDLVAKTATIRRGLEMGFDPDCDVPSGA